MNLNIKNRANAVANQLLGTGSRIKNKVTDLAQSADQNHENISNHVDSVAKATKVVAGVALAGAVVAAPTGLTAFGVAIGIVGTPAIITIAPIIASVAGVAITISAGASLYTKLRRKQIGERKEKQEPNA